MVLAVVIGVFGGLKLLVTTPPYQKDQRIMDSWEISQSCMHRNAKKATSLENACEVAFRAALEITVGVTLPEEFEMV